MLGLALVDSINPSALAVTLWWLAQPAAAPRVLAYVAGIALAYFTLGTALMLGLGAAVESLGNALDHPVVLALQLLLGLCLLGYGILAPSGKAAATEPKLPRIGGLAGMMLLGVTVTLVEMTTALPYFAAVAVMTSAKLQVTQWLPLLLVYNAIFIAPPLLLLGLHLLLGRRMQQRFAHWRARLQRGAREAVLWLMAIAGVALAGDAIGRYLGHRGDAGNVREALSWSAATLPVKTGAERHSA
ncbi:MAG: GAP family protein [Pseudoxanthomonas sp.]